MTPYQSECQLRIGVGYQMEILSGPSENRIQAKLGALGSNLVDGHWWKAIQCLQNP